MKLITTDWIKHLNGEYLILFSNLWKNKAVSWFRILEITLYERSVGITILNFELQFNTFRLWQKSKSGKIILFPYLYYKYFWKLGEDK